MSEHPSTNGASRGTYFFSSLLGLSEGLSPLGLPYTLSHAPLRRRAPFAWLTPAVSPRQGAASRLLPPTPSTASRARPVLPAPVRARRTSRRPPAPAAASGTGRAP